MWGRINIEEIDRVTAGGNYGWHLKEGTFKFNPADGSVSADTTGLPPGLIDPLAQYDHDEGAAIIGGFVYRGTLIPQLAGKYIFADLSNGFNAPNGRLFYADLATGQINEFLLGPADLPLGQWIKGMGEDANGEIYLAASTELGPAGSGGTVYRIVPEPGMFGMMLLAFAPLLRRSRR